MTDIEVAKLVYRKLSPKGYSLNAISALCGNMFAESNLEAVRLEGDFTPSRGKSFDYCEKVDYGIISAETFATDAKGWGLYQLTYHSRKRGFLSYCKSMKCSIGDAEAQIEYLDKEIQSDFPEVRKILLASGSSLYDCSYMVLMKFENPANAMAQIPFRLSLSQKYHDILKDYCPEIDTDDSCDDSQLRADEDDDEGADFSCFMVMSEKRFNVHDGKHLAWLKLLKRCLYSAGYAIDPQRQEWADTTEVIKSFQIDNGLTDDGICGTMTWSRLANVDEWGTL